MSSDLKVMTELTALSDLFYPDLSALGDFTLESAEEIPSVYRKLLAHEEHMTVTVEAHHRCLVDVEVVDRKEQPPHYARKILLRRQRDRAVVQYGLVRINFACLDEPTQREIRSEQIPLGRVLINHNIMRRVRLLHLWRVEPGPELCEFFALDKPRITYGRTAIIDCNGEGAIELIEIVAPE